MDHSFLPSNALTASNKLIIVLGMTTTLSFSLKAELSSSKTEVVNVLLQCDLVGRLNDRDLGWISEETELCIFNCSEEQSLITIIEHSGSLQTHLALLIWEQESTKHKSSAACGKKSLLFSKRLLRYTI